MAEAATTDVPAGRTGNTANMTVQLYSLAFALLYQLPGWPDIFYSIYGSPMRDRSVYELLLVSHALPIDYIYSFDLISFFTREWVWNSALAFLNRSLGISPDQIFFLITTLVLWRFCVEVASRAGFAFTLLLINPLVVDLAFSQLRLALALAIVSFFWTGNRSKIATVLAYALCMSIHTAMVLFAAMHFVANRQECKHATTISLLCATGAAISITTGPLRETILGIVADRRAEYNDMSSTVAYLLFWVGMLGALLVGWRQSLRSIDGRYAIVILSLVFVNIFTGGYSTRFVAAAFPALIVAMSQWRAMPVNLLLLAFVPYAIAQWLYWLKLF